MGISPSSNPSPETDLEKQLEDAIAEVQMNKSVELLQALVNAGRLYVARKGQGPSKVDSVAILPFNNSRLYVTFKDPAYLPYAEKYLSIEKLDQYLSVQ